MAAKKTAATPKTQPANTSAPTAGDLAAVSATGAAQAVPNVETESAPPATPFFKKTESSPEGGESAAPEDAPGAGHEVTQLIVSAKVEGFRRAGRAWGRAPATVDCADFSEAQIAALLSEPMLEVTQR